MMNLALLFGEIGFISRNKIIEGIRAHATRDRTNVVLYTSEGFLYEELEDYIKGEYVIYSLPALENYDGVIVDLDSIQNQQIAHSVREKIEKANIPCVSFNRVIALVLNNFIWIVIAAIHKDSERFEKAFFLLFIVILIDIVICGIKIEIWRTKRDRPLLFPSYGIGDMFGTVPKTFKNLTVFWDGP